MRLFVFASLFAASSAAAAPNNKWIQSVGQGLLHGGAYAFTESLTDQVGARLAGSPGAEKAVGWAVETMKAMGLENVRREPVKVPRWVRGNASGEVIAPTEQPLAVVALGGSVGTGDKGISGEIVEVTNFEELKQKGEAVRGKIVFYNKPMVRSSWFDGYGGVVGLRSRGAVEAARLGAIGAITRSAGTGYYRMPHTGATQYDDQVTKIPFGAIAAEDADLLHRLAKQKPVSIRLTLGCGWQGTVDSSNVVGEIIGKERPKEIVLIGAHLDSWDLGPGATDDAAGCGIVLETARLIKQTGRPRRTLRVVLFMNEENGLSGARAYVEQHAAELASHVAAMEADSGAGRPLGVLVAGAKDSIEAKKAAELMAAPLAPLHLNTVTVLDETGADLIPMQAHGVPVLGVKQDVSQYFDWHHTAGDTLDKIEPADLALATLAFATLAYGLVDTAATLPKPPPPTKH